MTDLRSISGTRLPVAIGLKLPRRVWSRSLAGPVQVVERGLRVAIDRGACLVISWVVAGRTVCESTGAVTDAALGHLRVLTSKSRYVRCPRASPIAGAEYRMAGAALCHSPRGDTRTGVNHPAAVPRALRVLCGAGRSMGRTSRASAPSAEGLSIALLGRSLCDGRCHRRWLRGRRWPSSVTSGDASFRHSNSLTGGHAWTRDDGARSNTPPSACPSPVRREPPGGPEGAAT